MDLNAIIRSDNADRIQLVVTAKDLRDLLDGAMRFAVQTIKERDEPEYYSREEMCQLLHITLPTLYEYRKKGLVPEPVKVAGGRVLFNKGEVHKAISSGKIRIKQSFK